MEKEEQTKEKVEEGQTEKQTKEIIEEYVEKKAEEKVEEQKEKKPNCDDCGRFCIPVKSVFRIDKKVCRACYHLELAKSRESKLELRSKESKTIKIISRRKVFCRENFDFKPKIELNCDDETYSLSAVVENSGGMEKSDILKISKDLGYSNMEVLYDPEDDSDEDTLIYIAPSEEIQKTYTFEEFEDFEEKYGYTFLEVDMAYKKRKFEEVHSKKCNCGKCPNNKPILSSSYSDSGSSSE